MLCRSPKKLAFAAFNAHLDFKSAPCKVLKIKNFITTEFAVHALGSPSNPSALVSEFNKK